MPLQIGLSATDLFGGGMLLVGGTVLVVSARHVWRATAVFRATTLADLERENAGTLVRVSGTVTRSDDDLLVAPFSAIECVALRYHIEERRLSFLYLLPWYVTVHEATGAGAFGVRTVEESVPVVAPAHTVTLANHVVATIGADAEPPERISNFERESGGVPSSTVWRDPPSIIRPLFRVLSIGTRRYSERRAALGDEVTVVGRVTGDGSGIDPLVVSDRSPSGTVFRMAKTSFAGLLIGLAGLLLGYFLLFAG